MIKKNLSYLFAAVLVILTGFGAACAYTLFIRTSADKISGIFSRVEPVQDSASFLFIKEIPSSKVSMLFTGDIMLDRDVERAVLQNGKGDFSFLFENAEFLNKADITFGNLEGPMSDKGGDAGSNFSFRMNPLGLYGLDNAGFDILSVANNHAGDWGRDAFEDTLLRLKGKEILAVGGGMNKSEASRVKIIEKNGIKIGFLGFSDVGPKWLEAGENNPGISLVDEDFMEVIKKAAQEVDCLVVSIHFGEEYQKISNERQKEIAMSAINAGAKIVIGHHPHVIQEIENYDAGVIAYSLGNFIFDQNFSEETMQGAVLKITVDKKGIADIKESVVKLNKFYQPSL